MDTRYITTHTNAKIIWQHTDSTTYLPTALPSINTTEIKQSSSYKPTRSS